MDPLHRLLGVAGGTGDIESVGGHLLELLQKIDFLPKLFAAPDGLLGHGRYRKRVLVGPLGGHERIHTIERHTAVVADDTTTAIGIGQPRDDSMFAELAHRLVADVENAVVVRGPVGKGLLHGGAQRITVGLASLPRHPQPAKGIHPAAEWLLGLQPDNTLIRAVQITRRIRQERGNGVDVDIQDSPAFGFLAQQFLKLHIQAPGRTQSLVVNPHATQGRVSASSVSLTAG